MTITFFFATTTYHVYYRRKKGTLWCPTKGRFTHVIKGCDKSWLGFVVVMFGSPKPMAIKNHIICFKSMSLDIVWCGHRSWYSVSNGNFSIQWRIWEISFSSTRVVVFHSKLSMFIKFAVHAWSWCWGLIEAHWTLVDWVPISCWHLLQGMPKCIWPSMNQYIKFLVQTPTPTPNTHQYEKFCMQNNQLLAKTTLKLMDKYVGTELR